MRRFSGKLMRRAPQQSNDIEDPILESLQNDMYQVGKEMKEIAHKVIEEGISEYPVFVVSQQIVDIGRPIFDKESNPQLNWFYYASLLEEFVKKDIVMAENLGQFKRIFNNPSEIACIFVITQKENARFVFVPYES